MDNLEILKKVSNLIFEEFERYEKGECTYDKALENAAYIINGFNNKNMKIIKQL